MHTTKEAREELSRKGLKAIEDLTEVEMIAEGIRNPFAIVHDWSKSRYERAELNAVKNKQKHFDQISFIAVEGSVKMLKPNYRHNGERRTISEKVLARTAAYLKLCQLS